MHTTHSLFRRLSFVPRNEAGLCSAKRGSRSCLVVPGRCGWFWRRVAPVGNGMVASALRTTAGRGQQGLHISEVSSKLASLNPPKYPKGIVTKESKEINGFSILFKMKPMALTKVLKLRLTHEHPCLLFNRSDKASDSWGGLACGGHTTTTTTTGQGLRVIADR
jgi:hypothetical protein